MATNKAINISVVQYLLQYLNPYLIKREGKPLAALTTPPRQDFYVMVAKLDFWALRLSEESFTPGQPPFQIHSHVTSNVAGKSGDVQDTRQ